jgi:hypothetical protein
MKNIVFILLLICSGTLFGQSKMRAFQAVGYANTDTSENVNWKDIDVLVVITFEKKVSIYTPSEQHYDIIKVNDYKIDKEGNYIGYYSAIDNNDKKCNIELTFYGDKTHTQKGVLLIEYANYTYAYRLKNN